MLFSLLLFLLSKSIFHILRFKCCRENELFWIDLPLDPESVFLLYAWMFVCLFAHCCFLSPSMRIAHGLPTEKWIERRLVNMHVIDEYHWIWISLSLLYTHFTFIRLMTSFALPKCIPRSFFRCFFLFVFTRVWKKLIEL